MAGKRFSKVYPALWRSSRFAGLKTSDAKLLYVYFLTSEHMTSAGAYMVPDGYVVADLAWQMTAYHASRQLLVEAELIAFDEPTSTVYVERWFKHSPPMNDKHAQGCARLIDELEPEALRARVQADFDEANANRNPIPALPTAGQRWPVRIGGRQ